MSSPADAHPRIEPVAYRPPGGGGHAPQRGPLPRLWLAFAVAALIALAALTFFVLARSVQIQITPTPESVHVDGGFGIAIGSGHLLLPGRYRVRAQAAGYTALNNPIEVGPAAQQQFGFELQRLPGKLQLRSTPVADVFIDGNPRGRTPLDAIELAPGKHRLLLRAPRYEAHDAEVTIDGGGVLQTLSIDLKPGWAPVSLSSVPAGAEIIVDGSSLGRTPQTLELGAGPHELSLRKAGYADWQDRINVIAGEPLQLAEIRLLPADGVLKLRSEPSGAAVSADGSFRGQTPLDLRLSPGMSHRLRFSAPGYRSAERSVEVSAESSQALSVTLEAILGTVTLDLQPADAQLRIDDRLIATGTTRLELTATAHRVTASKPGFADYRGTITPRPGFEQRLEIHLRSEAELRAEKTPPRIQSKAGPGLVLVQPGSFRMGTPRGEQGRQANELQRPVKLTRAFYLATTEVSNAQFRRFMGAHSSGIIRRNTLDNESQPVVNLSWEDAVRYCNWLSSQDGLPAAYIEDGGTFRLVQPVNTGYRLPSEAEWEWAARFVGQSQPQRFPWGSGFPPPAKAGNFADTLAQDVAPQFLADYNDGYPASAPVGSFAPNALGLFDLGGNVAEWTQDVYVAALPIGAAEAIDPFGPASGEDHVIRGSSWLHGRLIELRLAYRDFGHEARPDLGFRVARYAE